MTSVNGIIVPSAPAFLDPLIEIDSCYYYAVPKFFSFHHPNTRWLIAMIKAKEEDRVKRKMELSPELFKGKYFQIMDYPRLYLPHDPSITPMFKRQTVLYLSALGISIYLRSLPLINLILFHKDPYDEVVGNPNEPQFASHLQDLKYGDFHAFPPCVIMLRMYCFEAAVSMLQSGWDPTLPLAMPMRRKFERRAFYFYDWLEAALGLLSERPLYPLQSLILNMTRDKTLYKYLMLPTTTLLPQTPIQRVPTGLIDVEDLPVGTRMVGVRSLLEMAEDYDRYLQMRNCAQEVAALKREALAVGLNPEILMIQAQDFDGYVADKEAAAEQEGGNNAWRGCGRGVPTMAARHWLVEHDTRQAVNANNSATSAAKKKNMPLFYSSEGTRVLYYAMFKDQTCKRAQVCLDSLIVMSKRGFYMNSERLAPELPRARDTRNVVVLLLNMIQREQVKLDVIFAKIQSGYKKFQHLEEHKLLENRRLASVFNISKMIAVLTQILLQSKELVYFVSAPFPPYSPGIVDVKINFDVQGKYNDIKCGVVQEFNSIKDGWTYLSKDMLQEVANIKSMQLHFRVGNKPSPEAMMAAKKAARKSAMKGKVSNSKNNMSNTNSCFVTFRKVKRVARPAPGRSSISGGVGRSLSFGGNLDLATFGDSEEKMNAAAATVTDTFNNPSSEPNVTLDDFEWESSPAPDQLQPPPLSQLDCGGQSLYGFVDEEEGDGDDRAAGSSEDDIVLSDIVKECDSLSDTSLLMTSLCREVQDLLRPRGCGDGALITPMQSNTPAHGDEEMDIATIEPEPGSLSPGSLRNYHHLPSNSSAINLFQFED